MRIGRNRRGRVRDGCGPHRYGRQHATHVMTLDDASAGDRLVLGEVGDDSARIHAIRFGMTEGAEVTCIACIPGGPTVLKCGRQEIAVGRGLARCIHVRRCGGASAEGVA